MARPVAQDPAGDLAPVGDDQAAALKPRSGNPRAGRTCRKRPGARPGLRRRPGRAAMAAAVNSSSSGRGQGRDAPQQLPGGPGGPGPRAQEFLQHPGQGLSWASPASTRRCTRPEARASRAWTAAPGEHERGGVGQAQLAHDVGADDGRHQAQQHLGGGEHGPGSARTKSLQAARPRPPPMAAPWTKLTTGAGNAASRPNIRPSSRAFSRFWSGPGRGLLLHVAQVRPGAEDVALALQEQQPQAAVRAQRRQVRQGLGQLLDHPGVEGVAHLGAVQHQARDALGQGSPPGPWRRRGGRFQRGTARGRSLACLPREQFARAGLVLRRWWPAGPRAAPLRSGAGPGPGSCPGRRWRGSRCRLRPGSPPAGSSGPTAAAPG